MSFSGYVTVVYVSIFLYTTSTRFWPRGFRGHPLFTVRTDSGRHVSTHRCPQNVSLCLFLSLEDHISNSICPSLLTPLFFHLPLELLLSLSLSLTFSLLGFLPLKKIQLSFYWVSFLFERLYVYFKNFKCWIFFVLLVSKNPFFTC